MDKEKKKFTAALLRWNRDSNTREMPWKGEKDPYLIWLSEIILQQTRVEQGLPYFLNFKKQYPTVKHLALAPGDDVMRLWQGLGYYSRARNLHETAKNIYHNYKGRFPEKAEELKKLKGIGDYTAAAIASFAFGEKKAVVDGNVIRVLARVFGIETPFDTTAGKKQFAALAQELIDDKEPAAYNQAIMDFGGTVCLPQNPQCSTCPLSLICVAYNNNIINALPVKDKKPTVRQRYFNYLLISNGREVVIRKRDGKDIWGGLYELPLIETEKPVKKDFRKLAGGFITGNNFEIKGYSKEFKQLLTHQKIHFRFIEIELQNLKAVNLPGSIIVKAGKLVQYAFPKTVHLYLSQKFLL
ncbi:MAG TPA: A/G-specific adenine glycosylase [Chitinophagales bacterium]|nr:A/G-specific adenine glycosylase [Chitinophagales bacterium]